MLPQLKQQGFQYYCKGHHGEIIPESLLPENTSGRTGEMWDMHRKSYKYRVQSLRMPSFKPIEARYFSKFQRKKIWAVKEEEAHFEFCQIKRVVKQCSVGHHWSHYKSMEDLNVVVIV